VKEYSGEWEAAIHPKIFSHELTFTQEAEGNWRVEMANNQPFYDQRMTSTGQDGLVALQLGEHLRFNGALSQDGKVLAGFLHSMDTKFRLTLHQDGKDKYSGQWNSFYISEIQPAKLYLWMGDGDSGTFEAYPTLPDNRYRGPYSSNFYKKGKDISFLDERAGYKFKGTYEGDEVLLGLYIGGAKAGDLVFTRSAGEWELGTTATSSTDNPLHPTAKKDGWVTGSLTAISQNTSSLDRLVDSIETDSFPNAHSVLVAHRGTLVYENYFNGFHADLPQDQRSAAKSIGSAMIGIALEDGVLKDVEDSLYDYLPAAYQRTKDEQKGKITLKHLLTMSSGLDVIWKQDHVGQATEDSYQMSSDWLETVLTAPMIYEPGTQCHYGSANPFLLGVALSNSLNQPLENYLHDRLFAPLGIDNYTVPVDTKGRPYFGGGTYLTPRDMLKFGELYRNKGVWNGQRILSESWIEASFAEHTVLENTRDKNKYGYFFWHETYQVGNREFKALEARGAGGQFITIVPDLDLVIVITSGNYRTGRRDQPGQIIEEYVLPVFME
jgi:CubicO group peptidase (beta-lactamase class C family)